MHLAGRLGMSLVFACVLAACGDDSGGGGKDAGDDAGYVPPVSKKDAGGDSGSTATGSFMCATACTTPEFMIPPGLLGGADGGMSAIPPQLAGLLGSGASICDLAMTCNTGCCTGDNKCGVKNPALTGPGCVEQNQPGEASAQCPEVPVVLVSAIVSTLAGGPIAVPIPGCCRTDGQCGLDLGYLGMGCVERSEAALGTDVTPPDGGTAMLESIPCTPGAGGNDGGADDGG